MSEANTSAQAAEEEHARLLQELEEQVLYKELTPAEAAGRFRTEATEILESK